jgi:hypothetical protein
VTRTLHWCCGRGLGLQRAPAYTGNTTLALFLKSGVPPTPNVEGGIGRMQLEAIGNDRYWLVAGFHRYCASIAAGFEKIPAVFHEISWCKPGHAR